MAITAERLREVMFYDPDTGAFIWKDATSHRTKGGPVGGPNHGYIMIAIDRKRYLAHRLAWLYMTGEWPKKHIDHINGAPGDNRFINLREASHAENMRNAKVRTDNTSGFKGVYFSKQKRRWCARIYIDSRCSFLGYFDTPQAAYSAYCVAAEKNHGTFARLV